MKRGRKPKPTRLKILQGNPGRRPLNYDEPQPNQGRPKMPVVVAKIPKARACWEWLVRELEAMQTLTTAEGKLLELYAVTYYQWREAVEFLHKNGPTYLIKAGPTTVGGVVQPGQVKSVGQHPQVSIAASARKALESFGAELGLSPASRTRIKVAKSEGVVNPVIAAMTAAREARRSG